MQRVLETIQKEGKLNNVCSIDLPGPGGANHIYAVSTESIPRRFVQSVVFQKGPRTDKNSLTGVTNEDLLEMVRDRLTAFQSGEMACTENAKALENVENALQWLNERTKDRITRGVLGTMRK